MSMYSRKSLAADLLTPLTWRRLNVLFKGPIATRVLMLHWSKAKYIGKFLRHIPQPMELHLLWVPGGFINHYLERCTFTYQPIYCSFHVWVSWIWLNNWIMDQIRVAIRFLNARNMRVAEIPRQQVEVYRENFMIWHNIKKLCAEFWVGGQRIERQTHNSKN